MIGKQAVFALLLGGLLLEDAPAQQAAGNLVFCKRRRGEVGTYLASAEGKDLKRVLFLCGPDISPRFSPDGKGILFSCLKQGRPSVWIADRDGGERKEICAGDQAAWSPDGLKIFCRRSGQIVERVPSSKQERIVSPPGWQSCAFPECSPDGKSLLFVAEVEGRAKLLVMTLATAATSTVADLSAVSPARWSPEGRRIAYSDGTHLMVTGADGSGKYRLTTGVGVERYPAWSPDGTMLAYCRAPIVNGGWMLCVTKADGTQGRVLPKEDDLVSFFGPDWHVAGAKPAESAAGIRPAPRVLVWDTAGSPAPLPARCGEWVQQREAWKPLSGTPALSGGVVLEADRALLVLHPKASAAILCPKPIDQQAPTVELVPVGEDADEARKVASLALTRNDGEEAVVDLSSTTSRGQVVRTSWRMSGSGPFVQVSPGENAGSLRVRAAIRHAVVPDRFASDLLYEPASYPGARIALPAAPLVLGFAGSGDALLEVASAGDGQTVDLLKDAGQAGCFSAAEVRFAKSGVIVGVLTGPRLWHEERPNAKYERKRIDLNWEMPGPGAWRLAVRVDGRAYSEMFMEKESPRFDGKRLFLTPQEEFAGLVDLALVYLYARSAGTPLDKLTPADIALDGMGIESFTKALDIDGLQSYRTAPRQTTWADMFAALRSLSHLYDRGVEQAEQTFAAHLCDDIPVFLEGMDGRLDEFAAFSGQVADLAKGLENGGPSAQAFLAGIKPALDKLDVACRKRDKLPPAAEAAACAAQIKELTPKPINDVSEKRRAFSALSGKLSQAASERVVLIRALRSAAGELRERAGMSCAERPEFRAQATKLRQLAQRVLRNRYYFEADWHGEPYRVAPFWLGPRPY